MVVGFWVIFEINIFNDRKIWDIFGFYFFEVLIFLFLKKMIKNNFECLFLDIIVKFFFLFKIGILIIVLGK